MKKIKDVIEKFELETVVRNVKPYWGEASYTIKKRSNHGFYLSGNASKFGPSFKKISGLDDVSFDQFISEDGERFIYKKCSRPMRLWLWFIAQTYGRIWRYLHYR